MIESVSIDVIAEIQAREEQRRHECEVRHVAVFETDAQRTVYLNQVYDARGDAAYYRLRADVWKFMRGQRPDTTRDEGRQKRPVDQSQTKDLFA